MTDRPGLISHLFSSAALRFGAGLLVAATAPRSASAQRATVDEVLPYSGVYRLSAHHTVVVSPIQLGNGAGLLLADLRTDDLRLLAPSGSRDEFVAGVALARPEPPSYFVRFIRDPNGSVRSLKLRPSDSGDKRVTVEAPRVRLRSIPVTFRNAEVTLSGTLLTPSGHGPFPAVVFAHGSEANDRHSFGPVPLALVAQGFAVLVYDKRGTGTSTGSWRPLGLEPLGNDLIEAIRMLRLRPEIDRGRIGIYGSSEGGWVAAYAAARMPDVAFVVTVSGGALTKADAYLHKVKKQVEAARLDPRAADSAIREAQSVVDSSRARATRKTGATGFDLRLAYESGDDWRRYRGPVLHFEGEWDVLEPGPRSAAWYDSLHKDSGHSDATVKLLPKAHHSLLLGVTGTAKEFETMEGIAKMSPGYWAILLRWLDQRVIPKAMSPSAGEVRRRSRG